MTGSVPEPVDIIRDLRHLALTKPPAELRFAPSPEHPKVFGAVMDIGHPHALITLVSFVDGATSLYFGTGGGVIGAGEHEAVRRVTTAFLSRAERDLEQFQATDEFSVARNRRRALLRANLHGSAKRPSTRRQARARRAFSIAIVRRRTRRHRGGSRAHGCQRSLKSMRVCFETVARALSEAPVILEHRL